MTRRYPYIEKGSAEYYRYRAVVINTLRLQAISENLLEIEDLAGALSEIRLHLPHVLEPMKLSDDEISQLLLEVHKTLLEHYSKH